MPKKEMLRNRRIYTVIGQLGPGQMGPETNGPRQMGSEQMSPGQMDSRTNESRTNKSQDNVHACKATLRKMVKNGSAFLRSL